MSTRELLLELKADLLKRWEAIPAKEREPHGTWRHPWQIALIYLEILLLQEELGYHHRVEAVVQGSWRSFLAAARHLNLFARFEGNEAARRSLRDFLLSFPRSRNPLEKEWQEARRRLRD